MQRIALVIAGAFLVFDPCAAKDWDLQRAKYVNDLQLDELRGPLRAKNEYHYGLKGALESIYRTEYDASGNRIRHVSISNLSNNDCYETTYVHSAIGDRIRVTLRSGKGTVGAIACRDATVSSIDSYSYEFDSRRAIVSRTRIDESPNYQAPRAVTRYSYDSLGRLTRITYPQPAYVDYIEFTYGEDPRGVKLYRRSFADSGNVKMDITAVIVYAADGRLLETQSPTELIAPGNTAHSYDAQGRLVQSQIGDTTKTYRDFDPQGNWKESIGSRGERVVRSFEY